MASPHILLIDGSLSGRVNVQHALMAAGFQVVACDSGAAGRKLLQKQPFALVMVDEALPDMSGEVFLREVRLSAPGAKLPIIVLSTDCSATARLRGLAAGALDYIGKPIGPAFLVKRVRQLVDRGQAAPTSSSFGSHNPMRLLLVDDSETFLNAFADELRAEGHDVVLAKSGTEALRFLDTQSVDGIVLDLFMPGLSGLETCRRIRSASSSSAAAVPILLLTGREDSVARATGISAGVDDYMVKSTDMTAMAARIGDLLRKRPTALRSSRVTTKAQESPPTASQLSTLIATAANAPAPDSRPGAEPRAAEAPEHEVSSSTPPPPSSQPDSGRGGEGLASGPYASPLFDLVLNISGLQQVIGRGCLRRAFDRAGVDPRTLTAEGLERAMPEIKQTLSVFLPKEEAARHGQAIAALLRKSHQSTTGMLATRNSA